MSVRYVRRMLTPSYKHDEDSFSNDFKKDLEHSRKILEYTFSSKSKELENIIIAAYQNMQEDYAKDFEFDDYDNIILDEENLDEQELNDIYASEEISKEIEQCLNSYNSVSYSRFFRKITSMPVYIKPERALISFMSDRVFDLIPYNVFNDDNEVSNEKLDEVSVDSKDLKVNENKESFNLHEDLTESRNIMQVDPVLTSSVLDTVDVLTDVLEAHGVEYPSEKELYRQAADIVEDNITLCRNITATLIPPRISEIKNSVNIFLSDLNNVTDYTKAESFNFVYKFSPEYNDIIKSLCKADSTDYNDVCNNPEKLEQVIESLDNQFSGICNTHSFISYIKNHLNNPEDIKTFEELDVLNLLSERAIDFLDKLNFTLIILEPKRRVVELPLYSKRSIMRLVERYNMLCARFNTQLPIKAVTVYNRLLAWLSLHYLSHPKDDTS